MRSLHNEAEFQPRSNAKAIQPRATPLYDIPIDPRLFSASEQAVVELQGCKQNNSEADKLAVEVNPIQWDKQASIDEHNNPILEECLKMDSGKRGSKHLETLWLKGNKQARGRGCDYGPPLTTRRAENQGVVPVAGEEACATDFGSIAKDRRGRPRLPESSDKEQQHRRDAGRLRMQRYRARLRQEQEALGLRRPRVEASKEDCRKLKRVRMPKYKVSEQQLRDHKQDTEPALDSIGTSDCAAPSEPSNLSVPPWLVEPKTCFLEPFAPPVRVVKADNSEANIELEW
ncbi:hypothetical protein K470DRAFT_83678 [Piedraia hortae CBS 480.64]|uniref:Uncharacterized protein n=1 Tax=Piedraia hortae CBS 480.64 TaxID=1314780 RepID=A0A6A7C9D8_9PEZI|nr:hypothetical protein K470DRAFT_83678 [Piedraia hortae CBS 480.64]